MDLRDMKPAYVEVLVVPNGYLVTFAGDDKYVGKSIDEVSKLLREKLLMPQQHATKRAGQGAL